MAPVALHIALTALVFILCSLRAPSGGDRTPRQLLAAARRKGVIRCAARALWAVLVVALLTLGSAGAITARTAYGVATVVWLVGSGLAELGDRPVEVGSA